MLTEHVPVPHESISQSILNFSPCCENYFSSRSHGCAAMIGESNFIKAIAKIFLAVVLRPKSTGQVENF